jgi:hypothetical protein
MEDHYNFPIEDKLHLQSKKSFHIKKTQYLFIIRNCGYTNGCTISEHGRGCPIVKILDSLFYACLDLLSIWRILGNR